MRPKRCWLTATAAFRWTPAYAFQPTTERSWCHHRALTATATSACWRRTRRTGQRWWLPVGGVDRPNLRGVPAVVHPLRRADAHHRLHHAQRRDPQNTDKYWTTSGWRQSRRASHRHAGRRCGMALMRKPLRGLSQPQTEMKQPNRCRTLGSISASVGDLS